MNEPDTDFASPQPSRLKRWMREPLLHFLLIGVTLFAIYHWLNPTSLNTDTSRRIELTNDDIRQLEISWAAQWQRPPLRTKCAIWSRTRCAKKFFIAKAWRSVLIEATRS